MMVKSFWLDNIIKAVAVALLFALTFLLPHLTQQHVDVVDLTNAAYAAGAGAATFLVSVLTMLVGDKYSGRFIEPPAAPDDAGTDA